MRFRHLTILLLPLAVVLWVRYDNSTTQEPTADVSAVSVSETHASKQDSAKASTNVSEQPMAAAKYLLVSGPFAEPADEKDQKPEDKPLLADFMQQKLNSSTMILRGLMTDDLEMVETNADRLLKMSHEAKWRASNDMMYLQHSTQFRHAVDDLRKKAADMSTDGASLAWVNVTMSCIQCHQWVRNMILADLSPETSAR